MAAVCMRIGELAMRLYRVSRDVSGRLVVASAVHVGVCVTARPAGPAHAAIWARL